MSTVLALPPRLAAGLSDFLETLAAEAGLAGATLRSYRSQASRFLGSRGAAGTVDWYQILPEHVVAWLEALRAQGLSEASVAHHLVALRMCLRHQLREGRLTKDPCALIESPRLARPLPKTLALTEVEALLGAPQGEGWRALRDRALLEVLYACGARVSEACALETGGVSFEAGVLRLTGKGGKMRVVPVGSRGLEALQAWLAAGRPLLAGATERSEVFLTRAGRPLSRGGAWRLVRAAALAAGIGKPVSPHWLRHSFASHLIESGADLRAVQEMLGHASIRTTEVYTQLDREHVRSLHRLYHPRGS